MPLICDLVGLSPFFTVACVGSGLVLGKQLWLWMSCGACRDVLSSHRRGPESRVT